MQTAEAILDVAPRDEDAIMVLRELYAKREHEKLAELEARLAGRPSDGPFR